MSQAFPWYTARGDDGTTGLLGAGRVPKYHPQPEAFGAVDEAGSMIGYARALVEDDEINDLLVQVQRHCYDLMAELAATPDAQAKFRRIDTEQVNWLAEVTDRFGQQVAMPREFVVPGDTQADAALDMARTVVRRAERRVSQLLVEKMIENPALVGYLNRLSSLLFVLGRYMVAKTGQDTMTFAKQRSK
ncbi:MAG: cob(I)yrinic acid a,c-diamide adenosyltransferase [Candidatus Competibacteraceae bacterium]|nr:cob(I)yrinic acid a,c-diamide adenosyltransferase [Candidatus Competibacteraceae bacterium]